MSTRSICFWWLVSGSLLGCALCITIGFCTGNIREPIAWVWWGEVLTFSALALVALVGLVSLTRQIHKTHYYPWEKEQ
jgi:hypothetical protein